MGAAGSSSGEKNGGEGTRPELALEIEQRAQEKRRGDGSAYLSLAFADQQALAEKLACSQHEVQLTALTQSIVPEVYARNQKTLSCPDQIALLTGHVAVIGLGGLGGAVTEILSRIGVGRLTLVDGDRFEDSNLNRQLLSSTADLGRAKADVGARRVASINPAVKVTAGTDFLTPDNAGDYLAGVDVAVDCLDSIAVRLVLQQACAEAGIPMVSAAIGGSTGQATVVFPGDPGLRAVYGDPERAVAQGIEKKLGTMPFAAVLMAAVECSETVTLLLGRPAALRGKMLISDMRDHSSVVLDLPDR